MICKITYNQMNINKDNYFISLPDEIKLIIFNQLPGSINKLILSLTCKHFYNFIKSITIDTTEEYDEDNIIAEFLYPDINVSYLLSLFNNKIINMYMLYKIRIAICPFIENDVIEEYDFNYYCFIF